MFEFFKSFFEKKVEEPETEQQKMDRLRQITKETLVERDEHPWYTCSVARNKVVFEEFLADTYVSFKMVCQAQVPEYVTRQGLESADQKGIKMKLLIINPDKDYQVPEWMQNLSNLQVRFDATDSDSSDLPLPCELYDYDKIRFKPKDKNGDGIYGSIIGGKYPTRSLAESMEKFFNAVWDEATPNISVRVRASRLQQNSRIMYMPDTPQMDTSLAEYRQAVKTVLQYDTGDVWRNVDATRNQATAQEFMKQAQNSFKMVAVGELPEYMTGTVLSQGVNITKEIILVNPKEGYVVPQEIQNSQLIQIHCVTELASLTTFEIYDDKWLRLTVQQGKRTSVINSVDARWGDGALDTCAQVFEKLREHAIKQKQQSPECVAKQSVMPVEQNNLSNLNER